ncbi:MAG: type II secretion system protein [Luteolibacter sp.]
MNPAPKSRFCRSRAFTLVELLIVIAIIITLAAMLFPMIQSIRKSAGTAKTVTNLHQIQAANMVFASDNGGFFVGNSPFGQGTDFWGGQSWFSYVPFAGMLGVKVMGDDGINLPDAWGKNYPEGLKCGMDVRAPQDGAGGKRDFTITMNWTSWTHQQDGTPFGGNGGGFYEPGKILQSRIKNPGKLIMFFESADMWGTYDTRLAWKSDDGSWQKGLAFRNKGGTCNVVFADGHVGSLTRQDIEKSDAKTDRYFKWFAD